GDGGGDAAELAVDVTGVLPRPLEVGGVGAVEEELHVLRKIGRVRIVAHVHDVFLLHAEGVGHPLAGAGGVLLDQVHAFEDAGDEVLDDVGVVLGEVGAKRVDVGDELVGVGRAREDLRAGDAVGDVVDVRRPGDAAVDVLVRDKRGGGFEGGGG